MDCVLSHNSRKVGDFLLLQRQCDFMKFLSDSIIASARLQAWFLVLEKHRVLETAKTEGTKIHRAIDYHESRQ